MSLTLEIAFNTPFPRNLLGSLSRSSNASQIPVLAPDGTAARKVPEDKKLFGIYYDHINHLDSIAITSNFLSDSRVCHKHLSGGGSTAPPHWGRHLVQEMGGAPSNQWAEQPVSAHVNIPKRKFERKIMLHGLHQNHNSMHVPACLYQGFPNRCVGNPPSGGGWTILLGGFNLHDGGNLRSDVDHSNLSKGRKHYSVNINID